MAVELSRDGRHAEPMPNRFDFHPPDVGKPGSGILRINCPNCDGAFAAKGSGAFFENTSCSRIIPSSPEEQSSENW